jgi:hypothetical protein
MNTATHAVRRLFALSLFALLPAATAAASPLTVLVRETVERACVVSGREAVERGARESLEHAVAGAVRRQGPEAARAVQHGGVELLEATARHGDDVLVLAKHAGPAGQRALALEADRLLPLARQYGPTVLNLEARAPGLGGRVFTTFGTELAPAVAREAATEDLPRLLLAAGRADSPATRAMLWQGYKRGGGEFLKRIDWKVVMATGASAAVIHAAHRTTAPHAAVGEAIRNDPDTAREAARAILNGWSRFWWASIPPAVALCLLWRFGLMPWHRPRTQDKRVDPRFEAPPVDANSAYREVGIPRARLTGAGAPPQCGP